MTDEELERLTKATWADITRFMDKVTQRARDAALREYLLGPRRSTKEQLLQKALDALMQPGAR